MEERNLVQRGGITDDGDDDSNYSGEMDALGHSLVQDEDGIFAEPHVGMEFDSEDAAKMFYEDYARHVGFSTRVNFNRSKADRMATSREFLCSGDGLKKRAGESCRAMLRVESKCENKWVVTKFVKEHSHTIVSHSKVHHLRPKRYFAATTENVPETFHGVDIVPSGTMYVSVDGNSVPAEMNHVGKNMPASRLNQSVKNISALGYTEGYSSRRTLGRDAQNLLDYFKKMQAENPGFYYAIQLDDENRMANAFWADARSRTAYSHFGDAVTLETTYRTNRYTVPFAPFTGVNHHGQIILFGCALLLDESEATFVWLFKTFLAAMNDRAPVSLTTDKDRAIQAAVTQVFPEARHCVNKWHVLREGEEKMAHVCLAHPHFQAELCNCINMTKTIEEFESFWTSILDKYDLKRNDWLHSIYDARRQWVPVYFRDSFFAAVTPSLGFESSFFDGYVNQQTTLPMFFRQYERALENSFEREVEADFDTICTTPVLRTPSPMEKQAANLYTKRIFSKFQEELVETFVYTANRVDGDGHNSTYRVAKFEDDHKAYFVSLNIAEMKANCSCKMFEYSGILCRHVLTVFTVTNVLTLPSHYILKRWTRNAKTMVVADEHSEIQVHESLTTRYNNLCKEAIRFAEEGAIASETYISALVSLREVGKKVAGVKKSVARVAPSSSQVSGIGYDDRRPSIVKPEMTPLLWPQQDEIVRRFNLNDAGVPGQPISNSNVPRVGSLKRDVGHTDNMVVLPCLKSMTWVMENKNSTPADRVAVINLKLQDYARTPAGESEVKFSLSSVTLEPMLRSMAYISEQLSTPANKVAVINLKLQDTETTSGESEVKFQVSRDTLGAMLRSMAYIREQLSNTVEPRQDNPTKRLRK
ncbi:protein FAR1-RELATED SEQUENCE 3 [Sesamum indicum]|uniref:Protein FAR1-RELATED SEQUENCE n=1 Tax=Sesamum indicum TaxID=4182 RepID=A0A6I9TVW9_SESIN|nr:protein FAR1-RELATED SEQUENCE 3 [Sesamum indicum]XP_011090246.1 protein FAR1-RELATED SEQUENCE 3 [Sesamum indicum]XP_011090247.1 protein FAR1-RELATED SEQUENCE 3 [Sesamum indicum]XP_020552429.1 protein FAR1-RELATED SEQUENCE 3 [Sesamum indicum]